MSPLLEERLPLVSESIGWPSRSKPRTNTEMPAGAVYHTLTEPLCRSMRSTRARLPPTACVVSQAAPPPRLASPVKSARGGEVAATDVGSGPPLWASPGWLDRASQRPVSDAPDWLEDCGWSMK